MHDFGTCKENAAVQCKLPTNSVDKHIFKKFLNKNPDFEEEEESSDFGNEEQHPEFEEAIPYLYATII